MRGGEPEAFPVRAGQEVRLPAPPSAVDGPDGMDNVTGFERAPAREHGLSRGAPADTAAFFHYPRSSRAVDSAIDSPAAGQV